MAENALSKSVRIGVMPAQSVRVASALTIMSALRVKGLFAKKTGRHALLLPADARNAHS
jgi:hypothetical protein